MTSKPPRKGDLTTTFQKHARRTFRDALERTKIWGVPTRIIPFSEIESMAPANLDRQNIWSRDFNQLSAREQDFYRYHAVDIWEENDHKVEKKRKQPRQLYEKVQSAFYSSNGSLNNVVSFVHYGDELSNADNEPEGTGAPAEEHTVARDFAYVMIDDMHTADYLLEAWLQPAAFESLRKTGINDDALHYWILQHEFAHITGAGEAQADMMASAVYIKELNDDTLPRMMADVRALTAISNLRSYAKIDHMLEHPQRLRDRWLLRRRKMKKALESIAENLRTYGWSCVEGIDYMTGQGVVRTIKMDERDVFSLSKAATEARNQMALELVQEVHAHSGRTYTADASLSETSFARDVRAYLAEIAVSDASTLPERTQIKIDIGKRYLSAVDNLLKRDFEPEGGSMLSPQHARANPFPRRFRKPVAARRLA